MPTRNLGVFAYNFFGLYPSPAIRNARRSNTSGSARRDAANFLVPSIGFQKVLTAPEKSILLLHL